MSRWIHDVASLTPRAIYRVDSAAGSDSPAAVSLPGTGFPVLGALLAADDAGRLPRFQVSTATVYLKPLDPVTGQAGAPVTSTSTWDLDGLPRDTESPGTDGWLRRWARDWEDTLITGAVTRDPTTGAVLSAAVTWPDGSSGTFTGIPTLVHAAEGHLDSWTVTFVPSGGGTSKTVTQPAMTRDSEGNVTNVPPLTITSV